MDYRTIERIYQACMSDQCPDTPVLGLALALHQIVYYSLLILENESHAYMYVVDTGVEDQNLTAAYAPYCKMNYLSLSLKSIRGAYDDLFRYER